MAEKDHTYRLRVQVDKKRDIIDLPALSLGGISVDPEVVPLIHAFNAALEGEGVKGRVRDLTKSKVFVLETLAENQEAAKAIEDQVLKARDPLNNDKGLLANHVYEIQTSSLIPPIKTEQVSNKNL